MKGSGNSLFWTAASKLKHQGAKRTHVFPEFPNLKKMYEKPLEKMSVLYEN